MEKRRVLPTLRFIVLTIIVLVLVFCAVVITVLNMYKPSVKVYLGDRFIGYFSSKEQFDEIYSDLVTEKQNIDPNVKVYLEEEPTFETSYIRDMLFASQNVYDDLRAELKTEYTVYHVAVNGENKMAFNNSDDAEKYAEDLESKVTSLKAEIKEEKVNNLEEMTTTARADEILKDLVDRNQPVQTPKNNVSSEQFADSAIWPTAAKYVMSTFGWRREFGDFHTGIDIAGNAGLDIYAYQPGVVTFSGYSSSYGNNVRIDHGNGMSTLYAHCSKLVASTGQRVEQGQVIAKVGRTGWATGNHLHFEIRINGTPVNPYPYIINKQP